MIKAAMSEKDLLRFCDELVVPLPSKAIQKRIAHALDQLDRATRLVEVAKAQVWEDTSNPRGATAQFEPLLDESVTSWAAQLPYPVAGALWTMESKASSPKERLDQAFRVWESYAIFLAAVLLSACQQDGDLAERELTAIHSVLDKHNLHASRSTFATWRVVIDRLSATFRTMATGADRDRLLQMFGDPAPSSLDRILDRKTSQLLGEVNTARNSWEGHPAAYGRPEVESQVETLEAYLLQLRESVGTAWTNLRLLRAGAARQVRGELRIEAEVVMGTAVPFRRETISVGRLVDADALFLAADGAATPLPLSSLIQLQPAPSEDRYTCYFYSRLESETSARYVSYQVSSEAERTSQVEPEMVALLARLDT